MRLFRTLAVFVVLASATPAALVAWSLGRGAGLDTETLVLAGVLALASALLLAAAVAQTVIRPLRECVRGALEIARGRFGTEVRVAARNELGDLAYTFNHMSRELASSDAENRQLLATIERGYLDTIRSLAAAVDAKDPYTCGHSQRVADLAVEIGRELGLDARAVGMLEYGGVLHDIGKIGIPDAVLGKVEPLTPAEVELVRAHTVIGAEIVKGVAFLADAVPAVRNHHERWDGGGYPDRLAGEAIPLVARIVNAADTWDACTTNRPYQTAIAPHEVVHILARLRGTQIEPRVHDAMIAVLRRKGAIPDVDPGPVSPGPEGALPRSACGCVKGLG
jgi:putative nucleotidyltransferase with HDIG domain